MDKNKPIIIIALIILAVLVALFVVMPMLPRGTIDKCADEPVDELVYALQQAQKGQPTLTSQMCLDSDDEFSAQTVIAAIGNVNQLEFTCQEELAICKAVDVSDTQTFNYVKFKGLVTCIESEAPNTYDCQVEMKSP